MAYDDAEIDADAEERGEDSVKDRLKSKFGRWSQELDPHWSRWRADTKIAYSMVSGEQWDPEAERALRDQGVAPITWNRVQPLVDAVVGAQIQNRYETKFYPREMGDVGVAEVLTAAAEWMADEGDYEDEETDAFFDCLVCGLGWTNMRTDYDEEPEGRVMKDRVDPLEMAADPSAKKRNLVDMRYLRRRIPFTREGFDERFPEWKGRIEGTQEPADTGFSVGHAGDDYAVPDENFEERKKQHLIYVDEWQWYEVKTYYRMADPMTGQQADMDEDRFRMIEERLGGLGIEVEAVQLRKKVFYRAYCADSELLDYEELPVADFTYHAITGKRDRNRGLWYGVVKAMIDPQRWANKWLTQILVIINRNAKGGLLAEVDAFADPKQAQEEWSRPDAITWMQPGAIAQGKIMPKAAPPYPEGIDRLVQMAISSIRDVTGINQELLGMVDRDQPGILEAQRKEAGYAMLSMFFDSMRRYRKISGRTLLEFIQKFISPETLIRIIGNEGGVQYVPLALGLEGSEVGKFDVIVDEAPSGPNQKDKVWAMFVQIMPMLSRLPVPPTIWAEMVRYSPLPESVSQKIVQQIMQASQPSPEQQQAMQKQQAMQEAVIQGELQKLQSETAENMADAQKTAAEIEKTRAQTIHQQVETAITQALGTSGVTPQFRVNT